MKKHEMVCASFSFRLLIGLLMIGAFSAQATPTSQIWIPSTDVQAFGVPHVGVSAYWRTSGNDMYDIGPTIGVLPFTDIQMEVGADYMANGTDYDNCPFSFNAKLAMPEGTICSNAPALAIGAYGFGTNARGPYRTDQDILYGLAAETVPEFCGLPSFGRFSAGYYIGNKDALVNQNGGKANTGVLLSWDRTISEISDKLWLGVDYQSGQNSVGALSFGIGWTFTSHLSLIVGYDIWNDRALSGGNSITTQLNYNF